MAGVPGRVRERVETLDLRVDQAMDALRGRRLPDRIFYAASAVGDHSILWLVIGAARGLRSERDWKAAVRLAACLGAESALINGAVKTLVRRSRPPWDVHRPLPLRRPRTSSFPSGHATSGFMAASLLAEEARFGPAYYALAGLVAGSRVYVRTHHASDVLGGVAIGLALGRLARRLFPLPGPYPSLGQESEMA